MSDTKNERFPESFQSCHRYRKNSQEKTKEQGKSSKKTVTPVEPLPESSRPRKDGPGGE